jgi:hypothetical protein
MPFTGLNRLQASPNALFKPALTANSSVGLAACAINMMSATCCISSVLDRRNINDIVTPGCSWHGCASQLQRAWYHFHDSVMIHAKDSVMIYAKGRA